MKKIIFSLFICVVPLVHGSDESRITKREIAVCAVSSVAASVSFAFTAICGYAFWILKYGIPNYSLDAYSTVGALAFLGAKLCLDVVTYRFVARQFCKIQGKIQYKKDVAVLLKHLRAEDA